MRRLTFLNFIMSNDKITEKPNEHTTEMKQAHENTDFGIFAKKYFVFIISCSKMNACIAGLNTSEPC